MIQFKKATIDDIDCLVSLRIRDLKMFSDKEITDETIYNIKQFYKKGLHNQTCITLLGYDNDYLVSSATLYIYEVMPSCENQGGIVGQLTNVWVDDDYRHQGIASCIVKQLMNDFKSTVGMFCLNSSNEAIELYKKIGFKQKENYFVLYT